MMWISLFFLCALGVLCGEIPFWEAIKQTFALLQAALFDEGFNLGIAA